MKSEEMIRFYSDFLIKDLSVGDKMTLERWDFCVSDNMLAILDVTDGTNSESNFSPRFIVTLLFGLNTPCLCGFSNLLMF